jgi:hypothetical protein
MAIINVILFLLTLNVLYSDGIEENKMKLSQKRSCIDCRGLKHQFGNNYVCDLYYPIKVVVTGEWTCKVIPNKPCPKPKTYKDYFYALKFYSNVLYKRRIENECI